MENKKSLFESPLLRTKIKSANVKIWELLFGYFVGPIGGLLANGIFTSFLNKYYTTALFAEQLSNPADPMYATIQTFLVVLPLVSMVLVIAGNLFAGQLIERTRSSAGKARPWILLSSLTLTISCILMFAAPLFLGEKVDAIAGMILMAISYNLYYSFAYPLYNTANSTLIAVSTRNANQRGLLASAANMAVTAGVGLGGMVFPILLGFMIPEGTTGADARTAWFVVFLIIGLITFLVTVLQYFFTRERVTEETLYVPQETKETMSMGKQFNALKGDFNWWIILGFVFLFNFGGAMKNLSLTYYSDLMNTDFIVNLFGVDKSAASGMMMTLFTALGSIPMAAAVAIVWPISLKLGKRGVVLAGLAIGILGDVIAQLGGANPIVVGVGIFLKQLGCAPACYMILAMVSDTLDHNEARNGFRCDGFTMSLYSAIKVAEVPLAQAAFNLITSSGTNKAMFGFSYIWVEGICYALCIVLFLFYNVEKNLKADQEKIKENQKAAVLAAGGEWIEPEERLRRMQEEADRQAEESRIEELKAYCAKKGLNFEEEEAKYQAKKAAKKKK